MRSSVQIQSVFSKWLAVRAREIASLGLIEIIEKKDFPDGAPIHEDGSSVYDPRKSLVIFAVRPIGKKGRVAWDAACADYDSMLSEDTDQREIAR